MEADDAGKDDLGVGVPQLGNQNVKCNVPLPSVNKPADFHEGKQAEEPGGQYGPDTRAQVDHPLACALTYGDVVCVERGAF